ncbi:MAG: hypothetical protein ACRECY_05365 [Phyllobacterium sp.]
MAIVDQCRPQQARPPFPFPPVRDTGNEFRGADRDKVTGIDDTGTRKDAIRRGEGRGDEVEGPDAKSSASLKNLKCNSDADTGAKLR